MDAYQTQDKQPRFKLIDLAQDLDNCRQTALKNQSTFAKFILFFNEENFQKICWPFLVYSIGIRVVILTNILAEKSLILSSFINTTLNICLVASIFLLPLAFYSNCLKKRIERQAEEQWEKANKEALKNARDWFKKYQLYLADYNQYVGVRVNELKMDDSVSPLFYQMILDHSLQSKSLYELCNFNSNYGNYRKAVILKG